MALSQKVYRARSAKLTRLGWSVFLLFLPLSVVVLPLVLDQSCDEAAFGLLVFFVTRGVDLSGLTERCLAGNRRWALWNDGWLWRWGDEIHAGPLRVDFSWKAPADTALDRTGLMLRLGLRLRMRLRIVSLILGISQRLLRVAVRIGVVELGPVDVAGVRVRLVLVSLGLRVPDVAQGRASVAGWQSIFNGGLRLVAGFKKTHLKVAVRHRMEGLLRVSSQTGKMQCSASGNQVNGRGRK